MRISRAVQVPPNSATVENRPLLQCGLCQVVFSHTAASTQSTWRSAADADVLPAPESSVAHTVTRSWLYLTASTPPRTALHKSQPCRSELQTKPGEAAPS